MNRIPVLPASLFINSSLKFTCKHSYSETEIFFVHSHEYYEVFLTLDDNIAHLINESRMVLPRGTLVFIRPDDRHTFERSKNNFSFINFSISIDFIEAVKEYLSDCYDFDLLLESPMPPTVTLDSQKLNKLSLNLSSLEDVTIDNFISKKLHAKVLLIKLFAEYFSSYTSLVPESNIPIWLSYTYEEMKKAENFSKGFPQMLKISNKSQEHLSRSFKKYYNTTPTDFIIDNRLNYICSMLLNKGVNITDLIYQSGFQNLSWFYKCFQKKYGMTPKEYISARVKENDLQNFSAYYEKKD